MKSDLEKQVRICKTFGAKRSTSSLNVIAVVGWRAVVVPTIKSRRPCLRIGEAAGVRWSDIDDNVLSIVRRVYNRKVDDLKTKGSRRQLRLSNELVARLMALRTSNADG